MAVVVTHAFVSAIPDGADDTIVQPSDWNDDHEIAGLGTAAEADTADFATAAQGAKADTAVQPGDLGTAAAEDVGFFATAAQGAKADTAVQPAAIANMLETSDIGVSVQGYSAVLAATTASFTTADETKLDGLEGLQGVLADNYGADNTGVSDSTTAIVSAIAAAKTLGSNVVYFTGGKYRITTGEILLDDSIRLVGTGVPNIQPDGASPFTYTEGNTTFLIDGTDPAFLLGVGWEIDGISFWWPDQVGPTVDTTVPALFSSAGQNRSTRGTVRNCNIFNAYRVFDIDTLGVFGDVLFTNNRVFAIKSLLRLQGYMPEYFRVVNNFFSWGIVGSLVADAEDGAALKTAHAASGILIELDAGSGDEGQSMDGLFFEHNFAFGCNTVFRANSGQLSVSRISNNKFDATPTIFSWNSTGICSGSLVSDNLIYAYQFGVTTAAQTVFETIISTGNVASEYAFTGNKITYAQGRAFNLQGAYGRHTIIGNTVINWARSDTDGNYPVLGVTTGGENSIQANTFAVKDAPPTGAVAYGLQLAGDNVVSGNAFDGLTFAVVLNAGTTRLFGNASNNSVNVDVTVSGGTLIGNNDQNSWSSPNTTYNSTTIVGSTGATDNRILRADGTGGLTAQNSAATLDDSGNLTCGIVTSSSTTTSIGQMSSTANGAKQVAYRSVPAVGGATDSIDWAFNFANAAGTEKQLAVIRISLADATNGSEDTIIRAFTTDAGGAITNRFNIGAGLFHASATGGDKGNNTINYGQLWYNGVQLSPPGSPVTKTADFTVAASEQYLINNKAGSTCTVTLPTASSFPGRTLTFKNSQAQTVVSASSNVVPRVTAAASTAILASGSGNWCEMVSDGTNWVIMSGS